MVRIFTVLGFREKVNGDFKFNDHHGLCTKGNDLTDFTVTNAVNLECQLNFLYADDFTFVAEPEKLPSQRKTQENPINYEKTTRPAIEKVNPVKQNINKVLFENVKVDEIINQNIALYTKIQETHSSRFRATTLILVYTAKDSAVIDRNLGAEQQKHTLESILTAVEAYCHVPKGQPLELYWSDFVLECIELIHIREKWKHDEYYHETLRTCNIRGLQHLVGF